MRPIPDAVRDVLGAEQTSVIARCFDFMGYAEEEIARAKKRWPRRAAAINAAFGLLMPGDLIDTGEELYRSHCRELLARVMKGEDVEPGTDAECCLAMMRASLNAPLTGHHAYVYGIVFARALPGHADLMQDVGREMYEGQANEIIGDLRKRIGRLAGRRKKAAA
jgi:hypothetical protein